MFIFFHKKKSNIYVYSAPFGKVTIKYSFWYSTEAAKTCITTMVVQAGYKVTIELISCNSNKSN